MQLINLLNKIEVFNDITQYLKAEVTKICYDTNENLKGSIFFCLRGTNTDGHDFLQQAKEKGALFAVVEKCNTEVEIPQILVQDTRVAFALVCANFYHNPAKKLKIIGVTGTNGKTSTCLILKEIFMHAGKVVGVIGTLGYYINNESFSYNLTTPDPIKLHEIFAAFVEAGVEYVFMEVSAHAIYYKKIVGIHFKMAVLTNITQDHLEFFKNMDNYANTKLSFLNAKSVNMVIANVDDRYFHKIEKQNLITYGIKNPAESFAIDISLKIGSSDYTLNIMDNVMNISTHLSGLFQVYNALAAVTVAVLCGLESQTIQSALNQIEDINGRFHVIHTKKGEIVLDFAHTPDGLENILNSVKMASFKEIICVFGCNGNRDRLKRPMMGKIAQEYCEKVFLTSDNPRYENPELIARDILQGVSQKEKFVIETDRKKAILYALTELEEDKIVVICGKGGEKYQDINGVQVPYEDMTEIDHIIKLLNLN